MKSVEEILKGYGFNGVSDYEKLIRLIYQVSEATGINLEHVVEALDRNIDRGGNEND